jgi:hypothetical protein
MQWRQWLMAAEMAINVGEEIIYSIGIGENEIWLIGSIINRIGHLVKAAGLQKAAGEISKPRKWHPAYEEGNEGVKKSCEANGYWRLIAKIINNGVKQLQ